MAHITMHGRPLETVGELPKVGDPAPDFTGVRLDMSDASLKDFKGKILILNIYPSVDTPTCAKSVRRFNAEEDKLLKTIIVCVSMDLPTAITRFVTAENLGNVTPLSMFRNPEFGLNYGLTIVGGSLRGIFSRSVVIVDPEGNVAYTEQVSDLAKEPDYEAALAASKKIVEKAAL